MWSAIDQENQGVQAVESYKANVKIRVFKQLREKQAGSEELWLTSALQGLYMIMTLAMVIMTMVIMAMIVMLVIKWWRDYGDDGNYGDDGDDGDYGNNEKDKITMELMKKGWNSAGTAPYIIFSIFNFQFANVYDDVEEKRHLIIVMSRSK